MPNYKTEKYIYHLTPVGNIDGILASGLLARAELDDFVDVAGKSIISKRSEYGLDKYVPFHWVYGSQFDYSVHKTYVEEFLYIAIDRGVAKDDSWKVIPKHPLSYSGTPEILDYSVGFEKINWYNMKPHYEHFYRNYNYNFIHKGKCNLTTMAECLSPDAVPASKFSKIFVNNEDTMHDICDMIEELAVEAGLAAREKEVCGNELQWIGVEVYEIGEGVEVVGSGMNFGIEISPNMFRYYE
ncbi:DarT ssDNA thymidine ADP-ribosyltransferase family protein [Pantoea sp. 18069]|uniref:DarT ssDNA thymidine ADP-ribosyltransferase family protein n=1 Tax=Pantoea sp. 18069 TaxID=2681415 RepID=UPI00135CD246|nr:DarT ssDNA thymidine ADP-ribosyltransferase family protein [Pantoea sp. 18069]